MCTCGPRQQNSEVVSWRRAVWPERKRVLGVYEFVMVLVSVIMGFGITTILDGAISALRADTPWRPGLIHSLWVGALFLFTIHLWLLRWRVSGRAEWTQAEVLAFLYVPVVLFALAKMAFPAKSREVDLTTYLLDNRRVFFGLWIMLYLGLAFGPTVFYEGGAVYADEPFDPRLVLTVTPVLALLAWSTNRKLHLVFAVFWLFLGFVAFARDAGFTG